MAYPPVVPPSTRTNTTPQVDNHPADHNALSAALTDIINELGPNPSGTAATVDAKLFQMAGALPTAYAALDGTPPSPLTGVMISAGTAVVVVNAVYAIDILLPFPNGLLGWTAMNGDSNASFYVAGYQVPGYQNHAKVTANCIQSNGQPYGPGNMLRINYIAVGW